MDDAPRAGRRLNWPGSGEPGPAEPAEAVDPAGTWVAPAEEAGTGASPETFDWLFRDPRRLAPQHEARGREAARPPVFLPPEAPSPPVRPAPAPAATFPAGSIDLPAAAPERARARAAGLVREVLETVLLALLVFLSVRASVQHYRVEGASMYPTLEDGEFLLVNSLIYAEVDVQKLARFVPGWDPGPPAARFLFHGPERGDIIIFHHPSGVHRDLVKRVIGLPGETVEIRDGAVYIDGRRLEEPYLAGAERPTGDLAPVVVPEGSYFVMGDNRNHSQDSRVIGPIPKELIVGKAMLTWWPRERFGLAPNAEPRLAGAAGAGE
ncbi:signal peptidase I [Tepidiforma sp.]|uniref:signal peptidase I n=1 Tax=Tepidiforma sp. TaxID=2682230 RepID=UPI002ADE7796|nr:signal peptidase I [Tepidiforma sp.]